MTYTDTQIKHLQVVYLYWHEGFSPKEIADMTGYAKSTVNTIRYCEKDTLDEAIKYFEPPKKTKEKKKSVPPTHKEKEFLYVGHYIDTEGRYILKIGTTNNLERRKKEHTNGYKQKKEYTMPADAEFTYDWYLPLSKYNTLRYEDKNREALAEAEVGEFVRNDRFCCDTKPDEIEITIKKTYTIKL